ncbi:MAG: hypothetical protein LBQ01_02830 [Prevotellaceae bacterium]|jgi:hypothetical protein|nr:hypothetical protein [Prevotellaceae bacterium]
MTHTHVNSIASLEALNSALSQYRTASDGLLRRFVPIFSEKLELLGQLETHFVEKVEQAAEKLSHAQWAYSACMGNPDRNSCSYEAGALRYAEAQYAQAESNLTAYRSLMSRLGSVSGSYQSAANRYENSLQNISSSVVPDFSSLIGEMKAYSFDGSDIFGGVSGNTVESSSSLSALRTAAVSAGVTGISHEGASGGIAVADDGGKTSAENNGTAGRPGSDAAGNVESVTGSSASATGVYVVAGVGVAALSAGILMHFKNHGIDSDAASKEIHRVLTAKYGATLGLLPPEKKAEYVKDYNALSKAVEEDVKKKQQEEIENKQNFTPFEKFKNYNNSLIAKREELLKKAVKWEFMEKVYNNKVRPVTEKYDSQLLEQYKQDFIRHSRELGVSEEETEKIMNDCIKQMEDEAFKRYAATQKTKTVEMVEIITNQNKIENGEYGFEIGNTVRNFSLENDLANNKNNFRNEAQTLLKNIKSNNKLIKQIENNDFSGFKFSRYITNGCGCEQAGVLEKVATKAGQGLDFLISGFQSQTQSCDQHDIDYYNGVPKEIADNDFQKRSLTMGTAVKWAKATSQNAYNNAQRHRLIDEVLMQREFNNHVQDFHISPISAPPTIEDSSLKYFRQAAKDAGIVGIASKK